eukprot:3176833-Amphidinium_carterae.1
MTYGSFQSEGHWSKRVDAVYEAGVPHHPLFRNMLPREFKSSFPDLLDQKFKDIPPLPIEGQPLYLDALSASLKRIGDPDWKIDGRDAKINYQDGVPAGDDGIVLPRTPAVFEHKRKCRSLDEGEFMPE